MKKGIVVFSVVFVLFGIIAGCTPKTPICDQIPEGEESTLCAVAEAKGWDLDKIALTLKGANVLGLSIKAYEAEKAHEFILEIKTELLKYQETGLTVADLAEYMQTKYLSMAPEIQAIFIAFGDYQLDLGEFGELGLKTYDFKMLLLHFTKQDAIVLPFLMK